MGTPMSCNFANLFMSIVESDMLNEYEAATGIRPFLWLRYIDDVFFLWSNDEESLLKFIKFVRTYSKSKEMKSSLNYDVFHSQNTVNFLDCTVRIKMVNLRQNFIQRTQMPIYICFLRHIIQSTPLRQFQKGSL